MRFISTIFADKHHAENVILHYFVSRYAPSSQLRNYLEKSRQSNPAQQQQQQQQQPPSQPFGGVPQYGSPQQIQQQQIRPPTPQQNYGQMQGQQQFQQPQPPTVNAQNQQHQMLQMQMQQQQQRPPSTTQPQPQQQNSMSSLAANDPQHVFKMISQRIGSVEGKLASGTLGPEERAGLQTSLGEMKKAQQVIWARAQAQRQQGNAGAAPPQQGQGQQQIRPPSQQAQGMPNPNVRSSPIIPSNPPAPSSSPSFAAQPQPGQQQMGVRQSPHLVNQTTTASPQVRPTPPNQLQQQNGQQQMSPSQMGVVPTLKPAAFEKALRDLMQKRGTPLTGNPTVEGREIDLFRLYSIVRLHGGSETVSRKGAWPAIATALDLGPPGSQQAQNASSHLDSIWRAVLAPFEEVWTRAVQHQRMQQQANNSNSNPSASNPARPPQQQQRPLSQGFQPQPVPILTPEQLGRLGHTQEEFGRMHVQRQHEAWKVQQAAQAAGMQQLQQQNNYNSSPPNQQLQRPPNQQYSQQPSSNQMAALQQLQQQQQKQNAAQFPSQAPPQSGGQQQQPQVARRLKVDAEQIENARREMTAVEAALITDRREFSCPLIISMTKMLELSISS